MNRLHRGCPVNRKDLIGTIAEEAGLTRAQATRALEACVAGIQASLARGDRVTISGFGTFGVLQRKARRVRNPQNGGAMEVAAKRVPRFAPGVLLKAAISRSSNSG
jgi:DNA-binding protein HU-beta